MLLSKLQNFQKLGSCTRVSCLQRRCSAFLQRSSPARPQLVKAAAWRSMPVRAASIAAGVTSPAFSKAGVPLVESLLALSLQQAAVRSAAILGAIVLGAFVGQKLLAVIEKRVAITIEELPSSHGLFLLVKTGLVAMHKPARAILPIFAFNYSFLVLVAFMEVLLTKLNGGASKSLQICGNCVLTVLKQAGQLIYDGNRILLIVLLAWFIITWKDRFLDAFTDRLNVGQQEDKDRLSRIIVPLSTLTSWGFVVAAVATCLNMLGIDISPLLAFGSVTSLVVGFAAQTTIGNVLSAVTLYTSRPFIRGDRVQLKSMSGAVIVAGVVEKILPMRTVIRTDAKVPVYINNKDVAGLMVVNESQVRKAMVRPRNPLLQTELIVRYADVDKYEDIEKAVTAFVNSCEEVEVGTGICALSSFNNWGGIMYLEAMIKPHLASRGMSTKAKLLRGAEKIVREHGARLSMHRMATAVPEQQ